MAHGVCYMCVLHDVWRMVCVVRCVVYDVWHMVYGVMCVLYGGVWRIASLIVYVNI